MLEIAEIKIRSNKQPLKHIKTLIFLVNVTLEKPPTTLGENQFESSSLFLKNVFLQQENFSKNYSKIIFFQQANLSVFSPTDHLETSQFSAKRSAFSACSCCCSAYLYAVLILLKSCLVCVPNCCLFLLLVQKSPFLSCSPSPNLLMKE